MEELIKALEIREKYNKMPLAEFIKEYEEWRGEKVPEQTINEWKFTGLSNTDLFILILIKPWN